MTTTETTTAPDVHFVAATWLQVGRTDDGRPLAFSPGMVLPADMGAAEMAAHPHAVEIRVGSAEPDEPIDPNGGSAAVTHRKPEGPTLSQADVEAIAAAVARTGEDNAAKAAVRDASTGPAQLAQRAQVDRDSRKKSQGRSKGRRG